MYDTLLAAAGWQLLVERVGTDICLHSSSNCPCTFGHSTRDLDTVVHGDEVPSSLLETATILIGYRKKLNDAESQIGFR